MAMNKYVIEQTDDTRARIVYLDRQTAKWWNARRKPGELAIYCGWYWIKNADEHGPFKSRSAAYRDCYYVLVLKREPPSVGRSGWRVNTGGGYIAPVRKAEART